jgi:hypothetical protein
MYYIDNPSAGAHTTWVLLLSGLMPLGGINTFAFPGRPPPSSMRIYAGAPARDRTKHAAIPHAKCHEIKETNGKENMHIKAAALREGFNIDSLAHDTGFARSTVAAIAHGGKKPVFHRGPNIRNAWVSGRMKEENSRTCSCCFSFLFPPEHSSRTCTQQQALPYGIRS